MARYRVTGKQLLAMEKGGVAEIDDTIEADGYTNESGAVRFWKWDPRSSGGGPTIPSRMSDDVVTYAPGTWSKIERVD